MKHFLITIIAIVSLISCGGAEERKEVYLEKARQSLDAGDLDKARVELKNVLQIDPKDAQAYFQLGKIFEQKKEYQKAFNNYTKAVELDSENLEYHAKIGNFLLVLAGDIDTATKKMDLILGKDPENIDGLLLKAGILYRKKDKSGAMKISQGIFSRQSGHVSNAQFLSSIYLRDAKYKSALDVLNASIEENPAERSLTNALANAYFIAGEFDQAEVQIIKILEENPDDFSNHLKLALFYKEMGNMGKAEDVLRKAVKQDETHLERKIALVEVIQQVRGNQGAIDELKSLIDNNKSMGELRLMLAKIYLAENKQADAEKVLESTIADFSDDSIGIRSRVYLANLYMRNDNVKAATSIIEEASAISPNDSEVSFVNAKLQFVNKNYEEAISSLRLVVKDNPENIEAFLLLSAAHKANGQEAQAREILARAYENNRMNGTSLISLANYHAKNKNKIELEKIVDDYIAIDPDNYTILSYKIALLNEKERFSEARTYAERIIELHPEMPNGYIHSVPYMLVNDSAAEAIKLLESGYKKVTNNSNMLEPLVELYAIQHNFDAAIAKIQSAMQENGESAELHMLLAKIQIASGDVKGAKISLAKAGAKSDLELSFAIANLFERHGDYDNAIKEYDNALKDHPDNILLINNLAVLLSTHRNDEDSLKRAKNLADKLVNIDHAVVLDTAGWVYYKTGSYDNAVSILKAVIEKSPEEPLFNYHLGMALYKAGDEDAAKTYLVNALANNKSFQGKEDAEASLKQLQ